VTQPREKKGGKGGEPKAFSDFRLWEDRGVSWDLPKRNADVPAPGLKWITAEELVVSDPGNRPNYLFQKGSPKNMFYPGRGKGKGRKLKFQASLRRLTYGLVATSG